MNQIVASKKCELCEQRVLIVSAKGQRPNGTTYSYNKDLPHDCDGGESAYIERSEQHYKDILEAEDNFKEWASEQWDNLR